MKPAAPKLQRCAIYTRKSTEHNLDLAFNSLDAQREACEAYIKSQAHEGWKLIPTHFDDGGLSGASLDRPALQALLDQVRSQNIDIIVVYKVDRLTRSLADFAKLVELFDAHEVSFVSVTQSFNTTSSMGRLTLNVLLSFAQFEREVIGERVRDKIAASKRKGIWVGGPVPFGYKNIGKKLEIEPEEAEIVRMIFRRYLELGTIGLLVEDLERQDIWTRKQVLSTGVMRGGRRFGLGPLAYMLKNRVYIGEIAYKGEIHKAQHEPILEGALFDAVQAKLAAQTVARKITRSKSPSVLAGLIFDDRGNLMSPSHAKKNGVRYRYYVSQALLQNRKSEAGTIGRVSAPDVELLVCEALREALGANEETQAYDLIRENVEKVIVHTRELEVQLRGVAGATETEADNHTSDERTSLKISFTPTLSCRKGIVHAPEAQKPNIIDAETRDSLLKAIVRARGWMDAILTGEIASFDDIAATENLAPRYIRRLALLAFLSPKIIRAIDDGTAPAGLTATRLTQALPHVWAQQEAMFGFPRG